MIIISGNKWCLWSARHSKLQEQYNEAFTSIQDQKQLIAQLEEDLRSVNAWSAMFRGTAEVRSMIVMIISVMVLIAVEQWINSRQIFTWIIHRMMKLGARVGALYKNLGRVWIWGSQPPGCTPPEMWRWAIRCWENQRRLSLKYVVKTTRLN